MSDYMIFNTIPAYPEAPVPFGILKNRTSQIMDAISEKKAEKKYLLVDKHDKGMKALMQEQAKIFSDTGMEIIAVVANDGFVYSNATAVLKVIEGEKPIPSGMDDSLPVYPIEELLSSERKMVFIDGNAKNKGAFTFSNTVTPGDILSQCGSGREFKGMYFGYPMGVLIGSSQLDDEIKLTTDYIRIFDESDCILDQLVNIAARYEKESCGRCVFGYEGAAQINMILSDIAQKKGKPDDIELLLDLCEQMRKQSLCDIGIAAANTVLTALQCFRGEIEEHMHKKVCRASVCGKFITYHILPDLCTGCGECQDACEDEAILGKRKFIHVIDQDECTQCGACINACHEGAIVKAGLVKPKCPRKPIPCK